MKKILAVFLALCFCTLASAQTTIAPGGAIFGNATGTFIGFVNKSTGAEEGARIKGQLRTFQTTVPTCTAHCGTSPAVVGTDTAMLVTMGATGTPATAWAVTFNGTWAAAPACIVQPALASMVVGKLPIAVVTTTTTLTVTTNGTDPGNSDAYFVHCVGVQ